jgi:hypothetical protein
MVESKEESKHVNAAKEAMLDYIMNMLEYVCSGNEKEDMRNMKLLAQSILERALELHNAQLKKIKKKQEN